MASLPTPTATELADWAVTAAPIQRVAGAIADGYAFGALAGGDTGIDALCSAAAATVTAPPALATAYAAYLDDVQMWRYGVEGDAYRLAKSCGHHVGLAAELLMATEAAMCTSGLRQSVVPWKTGAANAAAPRPTGCAGAAAVLGVAGVVGAMAAL